MTPRGGCAYEEDTQRKRAELLLAPNNGPQDEYLYVEDGRTLFKEDHNRVQHPPFGKESRDYLFDTEPDGALPGTTSFGHRHTCSIPSDDADLLGNVVLALTLPPLRQHVTLTNSWGSAATTGYTRWAYGGVAAVVEKIDMVVDGYVLQQYTGRVLDVESLMNVPPSARVGYDRMTGRGSQHDGRSEVTYYLPVPFFFCRRADDVGSGGGAAIGSSGGSSASATNVVGDDGNTTDGRPFFPLCALRRGLQVQVRVALRPLVQCVNSNHMLRSEDVTAERFLTGSVRARLIADVYLLDPSERNLFRTRRTRNYLMEEVQQQEDIVEAGVLNVTREISLNRSTKRIHWMLQDAADTFPNTLVGNKHLLYDGYNQLFLEANRDSGSAALYPPPIRTCQLLLGNLPREPQALTERSWQETEERVDGVYFTHLQPLLYEGCNSPPGRNYVFGYFFALRPFAFAPSGSYNMTVSKNHLHMRLNPNLRRTNLLVYSVSYNVLRVSEDGEVMVVFVD